MSLETESTNKFCSILSENDVVLNVEYPFEGRKYNGFLIPQMMDKYVGKIFNVHNYEQEVIRKVEMDEVDDIKFPRRRRVTKLRKTLVAKQNATKNKKNGINSKNQKKFKAVSKSVSMKRKIPQHKSAITTEDLDYKPGGIVVNSSLPILIKTDPQSLQDLTCHEVLSDFDF